MDLDFGKSGVSVDFYSQWVKFWSKDLAWVDFTILNSGFEISSYKNSWEVWFGILGLNWTITVWKRVAS